MLASTLYMGIGQPSGRSACLTIAFLPADILSACRQHVFLRPVCLPPANIPAAASLHAASQSSCRQPICLPPSLFACRQNFCLLNPVCLYRTAELSASSQAFFPLPVCLPDASLSALQ
jgi:hypothetical protein